MFTAEEIIAMSPAEFAKNWNNGEIHKSSYELLGITKVTTTETDIFDL